MGRTSQKQDILSLRENAAQQAKYFLAAIVASSNDSIVTVDLNNIITTWNSAAERLYGYPASEAIGQPLTIVTLPKDLQLILDNIERIKMQVPVDRFQTVRLRKQGQLINLEIELSPVKDEEGNVIGVSTIARDITERKRHEANLAFLAEMNIDLAPLLSIQQVMDKVGDRLAAHLQLTRCHFSMIDMENDSIEMIYQYHRTDLPDMMGTHSLSQKFTASGIQRYREGKLNIIERLSDNDVVTDPAALRNAGFGTIIHVPYVLDGEWKFLLTITREEELPWRKDEIELVQILSEKIYTRIERARAEDSLRRSEQKYRTLFNSIDEGYCIIELMFNENDEPYDWRFIEANPAMEKNNGLHDAVGRTILELTPNIEPKWFRIYGDVARSGKPLRFKEHSPALNRWFDLYAFAIDDPGLNRVAVIFTDITERKNAEQRQQYLSKLNETIHETEDLVDIEETVSKIALDHFGADRCYYVTVEGDNAVITRDARTGDLPSVAGRYPLSAFPIFKQVVEHGRPFVVNDARSTDILDEALRKLCIDLQVISFINVPVIKNGHAIGILCLVRSTPSEWKQVEIDLAVETAERIWIAVEKAKAEAALKEAEIRYMTLLEEQVRERTQELHKITTTIPDMVSIIELGTKKFRFIESEQFYLQGFDAAQMAVASPLDLRAMVHPDDHADMDSYFEMIAHADDDEVITLEYRAKGANDQWNWYLVRGKVFSRDENGKPKEALNVIQNITEKRTANDILKKQFKQLQYLNDDLNTLTDVTGQGFKEPLRNIYTSVETLISEEAHKLSNASRANFRRIQSAVQRMSLLTDDLIAYALINKLQEQMTTVSLRSVIENVMAQKQEWISKRSATIDIASDVQLWGNEALLERLFIQLLDNALKFTVKDRAPHILISSSLVDGVELQSEELDREQHYYCISFADNGMGIPQEEKDNVFNMFFRASNAKQFKGSGVGLAIAKKIMIVHDGSVKVKETSENGTMICCFFPQV